MKYLKTTVYETFRRLVGSYSSYKSDTARDSRTKERGKSKQVDIFPTEEECRLILLSYAEATLKATVAPPPFGIIVHLVVV